MVFEHYNLLTSMITALIVYGLHSLLAVSQSAFLNKFKACECIQLVFTTSQLVDSHLSLGYECSIGHGPSPGQALGLQEREQGKDKLSRILVLKMNNETQL